MAEGGRHREHHPSRLRARCARRAVEVDPGRFADARKSVPGRIVGRVGARTGGRRGLKPAVMAPISYPAAIAASLATVFTLRAVQSPAAGMRNLERPIPSG